MTADETKYRILMKGIDVLGASDLKGVLTMTKEGMEIKLMKEYDDYLDFVSNEKWREIIYEGASGMDFEWSGVWYTAGEEKDPNWSGVWTFRRKWL